MRLDEQVGTNFVARWGGTSYKMFTSMPEAEEFSRRESLEDYTGLAVVVEIYDRNFRFMGWGSTWKYGKLAQSAQLPDELLAPIRVPLEALEE